MNATTTTIGMINRLSNERQALWSESAKRGEFGRCGLTVTEGMRVQAINHDLRVLWERRRLEMAGVREKQIA